jgi:hypothetical protein
MSDIVETVGPGAVAKPAMPGSPSRKPHVTFTAPGSTGGGTPSDLPGRYAQSSIVFVGSTVGMLRTLNCGTSKRRTCEAESFATTTASNVIVDPFAFTLDATCQSDTVTPLLELVLAAASVRQARSRACRDA